MRILLVANPKAGARSALQAVEHCLPALKAGCRQVEVQTTERPGHAVEIARQVQNVDVVIAVGGDGTLHEIANGLMQRRLASEAFGSKLQRPKLGVIPAGSGNSMCTELGTTDPQEAVRRLLAGQERPLDVAQVKIGEQIQYSINMLGWGAVARINRRSEGMRWAVGARYTMSSVVELLQARIGHAAAHFNGEPPDSWLLGTATITSTIGKGMRMSPRAKLDDGLLDIVRIRRPSGLTGRARLGALLSKVYSGRHVHSPLVEYTQLPKFQLTLEPHAEFLIDGEMLPSNPLEQHIEVEVLPKALTLLA